MNFPRDPPEPSARCRISNRLILVVKIAHSSRRQEDSGFLLGLDQTEPGDPKKYEQQKPLVQGAAAPGQD